MKDRLRAIGWSAAFLVGGYVLAIAVLLLLNSFIPPGDAGSLSEAAIQSIALLAGYALVTWLIGVKALRLTRSDFLGAPPSRMPGFFWGLGLGAGLAALAMLLAVAAGHAAWRSDGGTVPQWLATVLVTAAVMLPAALAEELAFRGVPLITLSRSLGRIPSLVALAALFAYGHGDNPAVTGLALANIGLAGIFLGLVFFTPGRLLSSTGAHLGWNLAIAALAAPVSGIPLPMPWLDYTAGAPAWLTGGAFGPEGGALASLCILTGALVASRRTRRQEGAGGV